MRFMHVTRTFLFTDIEGSTRMWESGPEEMSIALARHDEILRTVSERHKGHVFKTVGDAFCVAFDDPNQALDAALACQKALHVEDWAKTPIRVRMALHAGPAESRDGDYFGPTLNRVARILAVGHGGQILISNAAQAIAGSLPEGASLLSLGSHQLKDLQEPETLFQLCPADLPGAFPPLRSLRTRQSNLPQQLTALVGRTAELSEIQDKIRGSRLVTLTGSGGCGKTRLLLQAGAELADEFPGGVWLVELAPLSSDSYLVDAIAAALGISTIPNQPGLGKLVDPLSTRETLLLLDNCEHLLMAVSQLTSALLQTCPKLKIVTSSREPLGLAGEVTYRVPSLTMPSGDALFEETIACEAVRLFADRAGAIAPGFAIVPENVKAVASICQRLDGIPLAIELAAARLRSMSIDDIHQRLDYRFRLLTSGNRSVLPRQQTLSALIDWSYNLLSPTEMLLFQRLAVFAGGWTLEAAESVCADEVLESWDILDLLTALVDKSLVQFEQDRGRYRFLETIRQYALNRLLDTDAGERVRNAHLAYFVSLAERASPKLMDWSAGEVQLNVDVWMEQLRSELDNLRTALGWGIGSESGCRESASLLAHLSHAFWVITGRIEEGLQWSEMIADMEPELSVPIRWLFEINNGYLAIMGGAERERAHRWIQSSLDIAGSMGDPVRLTWSRIGLGYEALTYGDTQGAKPILLDALELAREHRVLYGIAWCLNHLARLHHRQGDLGAAQLYTLECAPLFERCSDLRGLGFQSLRLARIAISEGKTELARLNIDRGIELSRSAGYTYFLASALIFSAGLAIQENRLSAAETAADEGIRLAHGMGVHILELEGTGVMAWLRIEEGKGNEARALLRRAAAHPDFHESGLRVSSVLLALAKLAERSHNHPALAGILSSPVAQEVRERPEADPPQIELVTVSEAARATLDAIPPSESVDKAIAALLV